MNDLNGPSANEGDERDEFEAPRFDISDTDVKNALGAIMDLAPSPHHRSPIAESEGPNAPTDPDGSSSQPTADWIRVHAGKLAIAAALVLLIGGIGLLLRPRADGSIVTSTEPPITTTGISTTRTADDVSPSTSTGSLEVVPDATDATATTRPQQSAPSPTSPTVASTTPTTQTDITPPTGTTPTGSAPNNTTTTAEPKSTTTSTSSTIAASQPPSIVDNIVVGLTSDHEVVTFAGAQGANKSVVLDLDDFLYLGIPTDEDGNEYPGAAVDLVGADVPAAANYAVTSTCCEPLIGTSYRITEGTDPYNDRESSWYGLMPSISPDERFVATSGGGAGVISIRAIGTNTDITPSIESPGDVSGLDTMWLSDRRVLSLVGLNDDDGFSYVVFDITIDDRGDVVSVAGPYRVEEAMSAEQQSSIPQFAGRVGDGFALHRWGSSSVYVFDTDGSITERRVLEGEMSTAWYNGDQLITVDRSNNLIVDGQILDSGVEWARTT